MLTLQGRPFACGQLLHSFTFDRECFPADYGREYIDGQEGNSNNVFATRSLTLTESTSCFYLHLSQTFADRFSFHFRLHFATKSRVHSNSPRRLSLQQTLARHIRDRGRPRGAE
jgi:hypothetical protein